MAEQVVYVVTHQYDFGYEGFSEVEIIGVFSNEEKAEAAKHVSEYGEITIDAGCCNIQMEAVQ
jgi:hypothetical protein